MVVTFEEIYLKELFESGRCSDKKHRFQPQTVKRYQKRIELLKDMPNKESLFQFNNLNFEALHGDKEGRFSIRVDLHYRIEFTLNVQGENPIITICNIIELSNHYN